MRFGATAGALAQLEGVRDWLAVTTEYGSEVMLRATQSALPHRPSVHC